MIKMEQKRRIKDGIGRDMKNVKGKAVIEIAIAVVILASVLAATMPMVSAESRTDNFNYILHQSAAQKVLIGQNLQFEGFDGAVTVSRLVCGDIENVYTADANNQIYNVNWPTSGAYYVAYNTAEEAQLSVEDPYMPLTLKVGTKEVSTIALGTSLTIDTGGMNLFPQDQVDLVIKGPDWQIKYDDVNHQQFTDITIAELKDWYGDNNLETTGWTIGDYTFKVKTDDAQACGLEVDSVVKPLRMLKLEVEDTTPPASTINLKNTTYAQTYINWTWNDPADTDLSHVMVYLNGGFQINVSKGTQFFNATKLTPYSAYTIGTRTVDMSGNKNQTMVNHTARTALDTKPPVIIHTPIITAIEGSPIPISATITDDIEVAVTLFFRITGEETWASTSMSHIGNNYSATIPASNVTTSGVDYYIEMVDAASNPAHSPATAPKAPYSITIKSFFGVELSVDTAARSTAPGKNALYKLTVNNTGAVVDTYTLSVKNPDNVDVAALSIYPHIANLAAGTSTTVRLYVTDAMEGSYTVSVTATSVGDLTKSDTVSTTTTVEDTTPPASIINLKNTTYAQAYINWTWNDPADADLSHVMVYLNGYFQINVSKGTQFFNATKLTPASAYTIGTRTVDMSGNKNQTMVNHTARTALDTKPPVIIHTPIITAIEGSPIPISATITDDIKVASATLFFRITGKGTWTPTSMSHIGNNYSAAIPASNVTTAGVEYYIEAVDAAPNAAHSPETSVTVSGRSIVTISATPSTINLSDRVTISGNIMPAHSAIVTLTFTTPSGTVLEKTNPSTHSGAYNYDFTPNEGGIWFVNATWTGSSDIAGNVSETVSFTVNIGPIYYAIIIAGGKNDQSQGNFDRTANKAYEKLLTRAFTHKRIFYLNPSMEQDADGDGIYDVDRISSLTNISYAIGTWAQGNVSATDTLLLYMVNHGEINTFIVNGVDNILTATDLNDHLDNFTDATGCKDIVVVYDACFSGSFIDELSHPGRTIITSTNINTSAIFDYKRGGFFSHCFFNRISIGETIKAAFRDTSNSPELKMYKPYNMTPLLDDNADRVGHAIPLPGTGDGFLVASKYIGFLYGDPKCPPTITDVIPSQEVVVNTTITIWSIVVDDCSINDVYASIFEPNFNISSTKDTLINLTTLYLEDPDGDGNYTASFTPTELGNYTLILHATDDEGYLASPKQCIITAVLPSESANESSNDILGGEIACREFMDANRYLYIKVMGFPL